MGDYTGLRVSGILEPRFRIRPAGPADARVFGEHMPPNPWPLFAMVAEQERGMFLAFATEVQGLIPHGHIASYLPWNDADPEWKSRYDPTSGLWRFQCSMKDHDKVILFAEVLAPILFAEIDHLEVLFERWEKSELYMLCKDHETQRTIVTGYIRQDRFMADFNDYDDGYTTGGCFGGGGSGD